MQLATLPIVRRLPLRQSGNSPLFRVCPEGRKLDVSLGLQDSCSLGQPCDAGERGRSDDLGVVPGSAFVERSAAETDGSYHSLASNYVGTSDYGRLVPVGFRDSIGGLGDRFFGGSFSAGLSLLLGTLLSGDRPGLRSGSQQRRHGLSQSRLVCRHRIWADGALHRREPRLDGSPTAPATRVEYTRPLREPRVPGARLVLSLRECRHGRACMELRDLFDRYCAAARRSADRAPVFPGC